MKLLEGQLTSSNQTRLALWQTFRGIYPLKTPYKGLKSGAPEQWHKPGTSKQKVEYVINFGNMFLSSYLL